MDQPQPTLVPQPPQPAQPIQPSPHRWWWYVLNVSLPTAILISSGAVFLMLALFFAVWGVLMFRSEDLTPSAVLLLTPLFLAGVSAFWLFFAKKSRGTEHSPRWLIFVTVLLTIGLLCGFYFSDSIWSFLGQTKSSIQETFYKTILKLSAASSLHYQNKEWGFEITFTDAWKGYQVDSSASGPELAGWSFGLPHTFNGKTSVFDLLEISVYSSSTWDAMVREASLSGGPLPEVLARTAKGVFVYGIANDMPPEWVGKIDFQKVIDSFKTF